MPAETVTAAQARHLLLGGQGLLDDPRRPATLPALRALIEQLGFVQIDSINTVARAHHLTLHSRLVGYRPEQLDALLEKERFLFEHWTHDASVIPTALYPHWWHRFRRAEARILGNAWWNERLGKDSRKAIAAVRRHLKRHGEVRSEDFEFEREPGSQGWWGWGPHKAALELMWHRGELAVVRRLNFQKVYALAEHVFAEHRARPRPSVAEHLDWACRSALDRLGVATPKELARYWATLDIADAKTWTAREAKRGRLVPVHVEGEGNEPSQAAWAWPDWKERLAALPAVRDELRLLCPFDPVIRDRSRALHRFDFDFRFEAFTPEAKRQYGYYVLPILEGDRLVGRLDPKLDRERGILIVRRVFWEPGFGGNRARSKRLAGAVAELSTWLGAEDFELPRGA